MDPLFQVHRLNRDGLNKANDIGLAFNELLDVLNKICPTNNREFSLVKTHLEMASFYAKKSMAIVPENQQQETK